MSNQDSITAKLSGGLGNQLFIFAAGLSASTRLNVPLIIDKSNYSKPGESRKYELGFLEDLASEVVDFPVENLINRAFKRVFDNKIFREQNPIKYDPGFESVTPGTTLEGYFQSYKYFENVKDQILERLQTRNKSQNSENSIGIHLRRGDYLQASTAQFHGITSAKYAFNALKLINKIVGDFPVAVYSDDLDLAQKELAEFKTSHFEYIDQTNLTDLESLLQMAQSSHFIMSNSSFSWWAAFIMSSRDAGSTVIAPRPWFADDSSASDLLLPQWLSLDKR